MLLWSSSLSVWSSQAGAGWLTLQGSYERVKAREMFTYHELLYNCRTVTMMVTYQDIWLRYLSFISHNLFLCSCSLYTVVIDWRGVFPRPRSVTTWYNLQDTLSSVNNNTGVRCHGSEGKVCVLCTQPVEYISIMSNIFYSCHSHNTHIYC